MNTPEFSGPFQPAPAPLSGPMLPGQGYPGQPMPPFGSPKKRLRTSTRLILVFSIIAVAALAGFGAFMILSTDSSAFPSQGDCVRLNKDDLVTGEILVLSCTDDRALYRVESSHDGDFLCPGDFAPFAFREDQNGATKTTLCMELNVKDGDCLTSLDDRTKTRKVDCADSEARQRVAVHQGVTDDSVCGSDEGYVRYPGASPHTVCLGEVSERANV